MFHKGDLVVLKSGGPAMTVVAFLRKGDSISESWLKAGWREGDVLCQWSDEKSGAVKIQAFWTVWLEAAKE